MIIKTENVEKTITEAVTTYVAGDNTVFKTEDECREYEESASFAVRVRLNDVMQKIDEKTIYYNGLDALIDDWRCEADYYSVKFSSGAQIKDFIAWLELEDKLVANNSSWSKNNESKTRWWFPEKYEELKVGVQYLLGIRDDWYFILSKEKMQRCFDNGWNNLFTKYEEEVK